MNTGSQATFQQGEQHHETLLCSGHVKHVYDSLHDPTKLVVKDPSGRIRVERAPTLHDHELDATRVRGMLDVAVNTELKRHILEPGGIAAGEVRFYCITCSKAFNVDALMTHLKKAADAALAKPSKTKE